MNTILRYAAILATCFLLGAGSACAGGPVTTPHVLSSGRTIKVISVGPMTAKFGQALVLSYQTDQSLKDADGLRKEVVEIWGDFRNDADKAKVDFALITANDKPAGVVISHGNSYNFVFERKPDTGWAEVGATVDKASITQYGTFETRDAMATQAAPDTTAGRTHVGREPPKFVVVERVPRAKGTSFGYSYLVEGQPNGSPIDVKVSVDHPPLRAPGSTEARTREAWAQHVVLGTPSFTGYTFDEDWEMVAGTWTLRVYHGSRLLVEKDFVIE